MTIRPAKNLAESAFSALKWSYAGAAVQSISQVVIGILLARLLGPEPFGLVAVAWIVIGLCNLVADFGLSSALVQQETIQDRDICHVFTLQCCLALSMTAIVAALSGPIGSLFHRTDLVPVVLALSVIFVIQAFGQSAESLLRRQLDFRTIQLAQIFSYLFSFTLLGVPMALGGYGVWSLVAAQISQKLISSLYVYSRVRHSLKPAFKSTDLRFVHFGSKVITTNIINWLAGNVDSLVVGKVFGVVSLGLYDRANKLMTTALDNAVTLLRGVLFPAYSRVQDDLPKIRQVYLASVGMTAVFLIPIFACTAVASRTVILGLYGDSWTDAVQLLAPLALAMPFRGLMSLAGPVIWGLGKVEQEVYAQIQATLVLLILMACAASFSVVVLAWGVLGASAARFCLMTRAALKLLSLSWLDLLKNLRGGLLILAGAAPVVLMMDTGLTIMNVPPLARLCCDAASGFAGGFLIFGLWGNWVFSQEMQSILERLWERLPTPLRWFVSLGLTTRR